VWWKTNDGRYRRLRPVLAFIVQDHLGMSKIQLLSAAGCGLCYCPNRFLSSASATDFGLRRSDLTVKILDEYKAVLEGKTDSIFVSVDLIKKLLKSLLGITHPMQVSPPYWDRVKSSSLC
jgi:hypothetical protein